MTVTGTFVVFVKVPEIELALVPEAVPVIPVAVGAVHVYDVPDGTMFPEPFVGVTVNGVPEQAVVDCVVTLGIGFTVTVTGKLVP